MAININVTANNVTITNASDMNRGEYNLNPCNFTFSNEYDNLIKRAVFSSGTYDDTYVVEITNDTCQIPEEILLLHGNIIIGVYAYDIDNNELQLRYSPSPTKIFISKGSYIGDAKYYIPTKPVGDLIEEYNENARQKLEEFNQNAIVKTRDFDEHVANKIIEYNQNAANKIEQFNENTVNKINDFNQNAINKTTDFNTNAQNKISDFNQNAVNKTNAFNDNATQKTNDLNQIAEGIEDMATAIQFATFEVDNNMGLYIVQANRLINTNFIFNQETGGLEVMIS